jgi:hypothetical protein
MSGLKTLVLQPYSKTMGSNTYDHIASQTVPSSNSIHSYYCRKTHHTVYSYPNLFHTIEHRLSAYSWGSDLLARSVHRSKGNNKN